MSSIIDTPGDTAASTVPAVPAVPAVNGSSDTLLGPDLVAWERAQAAGRLLHPHVDHYRDGGMGGLGEDHSVVGFVATSDLGKYREHDGYWNDVEPTHRSYDQAVIDELRTALRDGTGFTTPLMLEYDHRSHWAYIGEGNHRLAAAHAEHVSLVPVRVVRSTRPAGRAANGVGALACHYAIPGANHGYIPSDINPYWLNLA